jgi:hypothetical protein
MKQSQKAKCRSGSASGWQEPLAADARDPDIMRAHRIARRDRRGVRRARPGEPAPAAPVPGR